MAHERGKFSSRMGFILAAAGSAVGLGNLVAFPVMASKNGGAAFLLVYLFFIAVICYPVMMAEVAMGRNTQRNPVGAFLKLSGGSRLWHAVGMLAILTPFMIAVFYSVITVWLLVYLRELVFGGLNMLADDASFGEIAARPTTFGYLIFLLMLVFVILLGGVKGGIERLARVLMPTLAVMLVALTIFVLTLDNAGVGIAYYLVPDFSRMNLAVSTARWAQAFFLAVAGMENPDYLRLVFQPRGQHRPLDANGGDRWTQTSLSSAGPSELCRRFSHSTRNTNYRRHCPRAAAQVIFSFLPKIFSFHGSRRGLFRREHRRHRILYPGVLRRADLAGFHHRDSHQLLDRRVQDLTAQGDSDPGRADGDLYHSRYDVSGNLRFLHQFHELRRRIEVFLRSGVGRVLRDHSAAGGLYRVHLLRLALEIERAGRRTRGRRSELSRLPAAPLYRPLARHGFRLFGS